MWLARKLKSDPDFPKPTYFGPLRYWQPVALDAYDEAIIQRQLNEVVETKRLRGVRINDEKPATTLAGRSNRLRFWSWQFYVRAVRAARIMKYVSALNGHFKVNHVNSCTVAGRLSNLAAKPACFPPI